MAITPPAGPKIVDQPIDMDAVFGGMGPGTEPMAPSPEVTTPSVVVDTPLNLDEFAPPPPSGEPFRVPEPPTVAPFSDVHQHAEEKQAPLPVVKGPPIMDYSRKEALSILQPRVMGSANLAGLEDTFLKQVANAITLANQDGYVIGITSAKRDGTGGSYHNYGEAVDAWVQQRDAKGNLVDLPGKRQAEILAKYAGLAGNKGSILNEVDYDPSGASSGPHIHWAKGKESGLLNHPSHHHVHAQPHEGKPVFSKPKDKKRDGIPSLIEVMARAEGIDPEVAVRWVEAESSFNPKALSPAGARGLTQMLPGTIKEVAEELGIDPEEYDKNPKTQIRMGMHYLKKQLKANGGNYARALAAYNSGPAGLQTQIERGSMYPETADYVAKILGGVDPAVADVESAQQAVLLGKGKTLDTDEALKRAKSDLQKAQPYFNGLLGELVDWDNPSSIPRSGFSLANDLINEFTFHLVPDSELSMETKEARDEAAGDSRALSAFLKAPAFSARALGAVFSGNMLLKGMRAAGLGKVLGSLGDKLRGIPAVAKTADAFAELPMTKGLAGLATKGALGLTPEAGPLAILTADTLELGTTGFMQAMAMATGDWLNGDSPQSFREALPGIFGAGAMGSLFSMGLGFALPMFGSLARNVAGGVVGKNLSDDFGAFYSGAGPFTRGLIRAAAGGAAGLTAGGLSDMAGLTEDGAYYGLSIGAGGAVVAAPVMRSALSKFTKGPVWEPVRKNLEKFVAQMTPEHIKQAEREAIQQYEALVDVQARVRTIGDADSGIQALSKVLTEIDQELPVRQQQLQELTTQKQQLQTQQQAMITTFQAVEKKLQRGKLWQDTADQLEQAKTQAQQQVQAVQQAAQSGQIPPAQAQAVIQQAQQGVLDATEQLKAHNALLKSDKDLQLQTQQWGVYKKNRATQEKQLVKRLSLLESTEAQGKITLEAVEDTKRTLASAIQGWTKRKQAALSPDEVFATPFVDVEVKPWVPNSTFREVLDTDAVVAAEKQSQQAFVHDYLKRVSKAPDPVAQEMVRKLVGNQTRVQSANTYGAELVEAIGADMKKLQTLQRKLAKKSPPTLGGPAAAQEVMKNSLIAWEAQTPKNLRSLNAETLFKGALEAEPSINLQQVLKQADDLSASWKKGDKAPVLELDLANPDMASLAAYARAALDHGDSKIPVSVISSKKTPVRNFYERLHTARIKAEQRELSDILSKVESVTRENATSPTYAPLLTRDAVDGSMRPIQEGEVANIEFAQGAAPGKVSDDLHLLLNLRGRIKSLTDKVAQQETPTFARAYQTTIEELSTGAPLSHKDLRAFLSSGSKDWSKAPAEVQKLRQYLTEDVQAEMARIRSLDAMEMGHGKTDSVKVASAIREARAAGLSTDLGDDVKAFTDGATRLMNADRGVMRTMWEWVTSTFKDTITEEQGYPEIFGATKRGWQDMVEARRTAVTRFNQETVAPVVEQRLASFIEKHNKAVGINNPLAIKDEVGMAAFRMEWADAIEDSGAMQKLLEKYGEPAQEMAQAHYAIQEVIDTLRASSPELDQFSRANYFSHRFRRMADNIAAARGEGAVSLSAEDAASHLRSFATFEDLRKAQATVRENLAVKNISEEEFLRSFDEDRAKLYQYGKAQNAEEQWSKLTAKERVAIMDSANKQAVILLADDPVLDPSTLYQMQFASIWQADATRQFVKMLNKVSYVDTKNQGVIRRGIDVSKEKGATIPTTTDHKGNQRPYIRLSEIKGFSGIKGIRLRPGGEKYAADELIVHPEAAHFLKNFVQSYEPPSAWTKSWDYMLHAGRSMTLMGTWVPHLKSMISGPMAESWMKPRQMAHLMATGKALLERVDGEAAMVEAVRYGVNPTLLERTVQQVGKMTISDLGEDLANKILGMGGRFDMAMAAADRSNPMHKLASDRLKGTKLGQIAEAMGAPISADWTINRHLLFKQIEYGALAGFHMRAADFLKHHGAELAAKNVAPEARLQAAYQYAAYKTNLMMGSLTDGMVNNRIKGMLRHGALTPSWFLSQAQVIFDGIDSLLYLGAKGVNRKIKRSLAEVVTGRRYTDQFPAEVRDIVKTRMANTIAGLLLGSFAMTNMAQYIWNGTTPMQHPPDKWFHLNDGENNWSGFMMGHVRPLLNFAGKMLTDPSGRGGSLPGFPKGGSGFDAGDLGTRAYNAIAQVIERQMAPPLEFAVKAAAGANKDGFHGGPMATANLLASSVLNSTALPEMMGMESNGLNMSHVLARLFPVVEMTAAGKEVSEDAKVRTKNTRDMVMSFLGHYKSRDKGPAIKTKGMMYDKQRTIQNQAEAEFRPLVKAFADAERAGDWERAASINDQIARKRAKGIYIHDSVFRKYYGQDYFNLSSQSLAAMMLEERNPDLAASNRSAGPINRAVGEVLWDQSTAEFEQESDFTSTPDIGE